MILTALLAITVARADSATLPLPIQIASISGAGAAFGYIDRSGILVIPGPFEAADRFSEGLARVDVGGLAGYIDVSGRVVISPRYSFAGPFHEGLARVRLQRKTLAGNGSGQQEYGYIDRTGRIVLKVGSVLPGSFFEGLAVVVRKGKYGFIDQTGREVIPCKFRSALRFGDGLAPVRYGAHWGFIDHTGRIVLSARFDDALPFHEGLAGVKSNGRWGFVDREGRIVISAQYDAVSLFSCGVAPVRIGSAWRYLRADGSSAFEGRFREAGWCRDDGALEVTVAGRPSYVDPHGRVIWKAPPRPIRGLWRFLAGILLPGLLAHLLCIGWTMRAPVKRTAQMRNWWINRLMVFSTLVGGILMFRPLAPRPDIVTGMLQRIADLVPALDFRLNLFDPLSFWFLVLPLAIGFPGMWIGMMFPMSAPYWFDRRNEPKDPGFVRYCIPLLKWSALPIAGFAYLLLPLFLVKRIRVEWILPWFGAGMALGIMASVRATRWILMAPGRETDAGLREARGLLMRVGEASRPLMLAPPVFSRPTYVYSLGWLARSRTLVVPCGMGRYLNRSQIRALLASNVALQRLSWTMRDAWAASLCAIPGVVLILAASGVNSVLDVGVRFPLSSGLAAAMMLLPGMWLFYASGLARRQQADRLAARWLGARAKMASALKSLSKLEPWNRGYRARIESLQKC